MIDEEDEKRIVTKVVRKLQRPALEPDNISQVVPYHIHNGIDAPQVNYNDLTNKQVNYSNISGTPAPVPSTQNDWQFSGIFSSTGSQTVAWTAGTLLVRDGTSYSISAGNTGTMTALTYIYFSSASSTTAFQVTTTPATAVGSGKVLIGVANANGTTGSGAILTDDFNSYSNGSIGGQGLWSLDAGTMTIQGTTVYEGAKAVAATLSGRASQIGNSVNDGVMTFYVRGTAGEGGYIFLKEGGSGASSKVWIDINTDIANKIAYFSQDAGTWVALADWVSGTWYAIQVQWRSSDHKARFNVNGGTWSSYVTPAASAWSVGLDTVDIRGGFFGGTFYFDTFQGGLYSGEAIFQIFGGSGGVKINGANVAQSSISGNLIQTGSIPSSALVGTDIVTVGTITTGTWNGTVITGTYGGTGVNNSTRTITIAGNLVTSGANSLTLTTTGSTNVTLPTTGTLATLAGAESLTNKKLGSLTSNGFVKTSSGDGTLSVDASTYLARTDAVTTTGQTADIGSTNLTTTGAGLYRLAYYLVDSAADLTAGAVRLNVTYTDAGAAQTQQSSTVALTILGTFTQGQYIIQLASGNIAYSTTHTGIFGTATYNLYLTLEKLN